MRSILQTALLPFALLLGVGASGQTVTTGPAVPKAAQPVPAAAPATAPLAAGAKPLTKEDIDGWLDGLMPYALARGDLAGAVIVVVKDGQVLTQRGFGHADVPKPTPVDPDKTARSMIDHDLMKGGE